jgi:hypothetical protein
MQSALKLYKMWALDEKKRPKVVSQNEGVYLQTIIRQLSQLFKFRVGLDVEQTNAHVKMCDSVLNIYAVMASQTDRHDSETWKTLMLTLLGVADYVWAGLKTSAEKAFVSGFVLCLFFWVVFCFLFFAFYFVFYLYLFICYICSCISVVSVCMLFLYLYLFVFVCICICILTYLLCIHF